MQNQTETKRQSAIQASINDAGSLVLTFANGRIIAVHPAELTKDVQSMATLHGLKQKLVDAAAISRNPETGRSATVDDKFEAVNEVYQRLLSGSWNAPREGGGNAGSLLFKALCRMYPDREAAVLREWLDKKSDAEKAALRKNQKVAAIILQIQAEAAKDEGIDSDNLLGELS